MPVVHVELFGVLRRRAGRPSLAAEGNTPREVLRHVMCDCPAVGNLLTDDRRLSPHCLLSLNGERFLDDLDERLPDGAQLLILSADAGG